MPTSTGRIGGILGQAAESQRILLAVSSSLVLDEKAPDGFNAYWQHQDEQPKWLVRPKPPHAQCFVRVSARTASGNPGRRESHCQLSNPESRPWLPIGCDDARSRQGLTRKQSERPIPKRLRSVFAYSSSPRFTPAPVRLQNAAIALTRSRKFGTNHNRLGDFSTVVPPPASREYQCENTPVSTNVTDQIDFLATGG